ncbi:MAG: NAD(P)-dependent oxidoreductase [Casimicrobiaceae bacterium]
MKIKKASPGLDQRNRLGSVLGSEFEVEDYDASRPLAAQVADADVLLVRDIPITREVIDAAPRLKLIQRPGDHLPRIDLEHARAKGVPVSRFPSQVQGTPARDVAEHAFYLLLALAKQHWLAQDSVQGRKTGLPKTIAVNGKTLGLVGLGNTGEALARLAVPFGLRVIAVKRTCDHALAQKLGLAWMGGMDRLHELLAESDFVSLHLPHSSDTVDLIGARELQHMRQGSYLLNISRAPILNREALLEALRSGHLGGAGLDVWWQEPADPADPLLAMRNVLVTPHIAADTTQTEQRLADLTADNVRRIHRGEPPRYVVGIDVDAGT